MIGQNAEEISARATALGAEDSSIRGSAATALLAQLTAQQKSLASLHRQLTDDGGVGANLRTVAEAVRTFETSVQNTWNQHQEAIANRAAQAKSAVMEDIVRYIEEADRAWRAGAKGRNGMSVEHAKGVFAAYTWGDRAQLAPPGFTGVGGDLRSPSTYGPINRAISQSVRDVLATAAAEVYAAQQTLETAMRSSLRALKQMQDPTAMPEDPSLLYPGGNGVGGDGSGGGGGGASGNGDGVFGDGPGGGAGASGNGDGVFGDGPGGARVPRVMATGSSVPVRVAARVPRATATGSSVPVPVVPAAVRQRESAVGARARRAEPVSMAMAASAQSATVRVRAAPVPSAGPDPAAWAGSAQKAQAAARGPARGPPAMSGVVRASVAWVSWAHPGAAGVASAARAGPTADQPADDPGRATVPTTTGLR